MKNYQKYKGIEKQLSFFLDTEKDVMYIFYSPKHANNNDVFWVDYINNVTNDLYEAAINTWMLKESTKISRAVINSCKLLTLPLKYIKDFEFGLFKQEHKLKDSFIYKNYLVIYYDKTKTTFMFKKYHLEKVKGFYTYVAKN